MNGEDFRDNELWKCLVTSTGMKTGQKSSKFVARIAYVMFSKWMTIVNNCATKIQELEADNLCNESDQRAVGQMMKMQFKKVVHEKDIEKVIVKKKTLLRSKN